MLHTTGAFGLLTRKNRLVAATRTIRPIRNCNLVGLRIIAFPSGFFRVRGY
jgi:hypothetical protein